MLLDELATFYRYAKGTVVANGFGTDIEWQQTRDAATFVESDLLRELAWVCLCSGFRESVVRRLFDYISLCFCDWESAEEICRRQAQCYQTALAALHNPSKMRALLRYAEMIQHVGFELLKAKIIADPFHELRAFPYIGEVTVYHLAKNLGFQVAKPDRHLVRLATSLGIDNVQTLCSGISEVSGDPINVVDIVLWRFATFTVSEIDIYAVWKPRLRRLSSLAA